MRNRKAAERKGVNKSVYLSWDAAVLVSDISKKFERSQSAVISMIIEQAGAGFLSKAHRAGL